MKMNMPCHLLAVHFNNVQRALTEFISYNENIKQEIVFLLKYSLKR